MMTPLADIDTDCLNLQYIEDELERLRLIMRRKAMWLRRQWAEDPLQEFQNMVITDAKAENLMACKDIDLEDRFYSIDEDAAEISRAISSSEQKLAESRKHFAEIGWLPNLDVLAGIFALSHFERDVLLLCLAPEIEPGFKKIYAYLQDDFNLRYATASLALALFGGSASSWRSLMPGSVLRRFRLLNLDNSCSQAQTFASTPLYIEERIVDYILGEDRPDESLISVLNPVRTVPLAPDQLSLVEKLADYAECCEKPIFLNLIGPQGSGKRATARELCKRMGLGMAALDLTSLFSFPDPQQMMRLLERDSLLSMFAIYVDAEDLEREQARFLDCLVSALGTFLIVGSNVRIRAEREMIATRIQPSDANARLTIWRHEFPEGKHMNRDLQVISEQFDFGPEAIDAASSAARWAAKLRGSDSPESADIWQACRDQAALKIEELAVPIVPASTWEDIILPEDTLRQLKEIADQVENRSRVYETWGFQKKLSRGKSITALFSGPSGTGKTMAAEILAGHLKLDLYRIDLSGVVSKYIGETEKNLKKVFDAAEKSGAILFFDEADALFGKRTEVKDSHDRYANIEVNYLLQRMEEYRGLAILATNRKSALDQAFLRRLRFLVDLPFPDAESRLKIWQRAFPHEAQVDNLDYNLLSRMEVSGGNIRNISLNAAFLAMGEGKAIGMDHIMLAARREYAKIDRLMTETEFGKYCRKSRT